MSTRRSAMHHKNIKAREQAIEDSRQETYRVIVAIDFIKRCPRRRVPAEAITELADARCYPRLEPEGHWTALDIKRAREVLVALKNEKKRAWR